MDLKELRNEIDRIDAELLPLFLKRLEISGQIAAYKKDHDLPVLNKEREKEILAQVAEESGDKAAYACRFYEAILEISRSRQEELLSGKDL